MHDLITWTFLDAFIYLRNKNINLIDILGVIDIMFLNMSIKEENIVEYIEAFKTLNQLLIGTFSNEITDSEKKLFINTNLDLIINKPSLIRIFKEKRREVYIKYRSYLIDICEAIESEIEKEER